LPNIGQWIIISWSKSTIGTWVADRTYAIIAVSGLDFLDDFQGALCHHVTQTHLRKFVSKVINYHGLVGSASTACAFSAFGFARKIMQEGRHLMTRASSDCVSPFSCMWYGLVQLGPSHCLDTQCYVVPVHVRASLCHELIFGILWRVISYSSCGAGNSDYRDMEILKSTY